MGSEKHTDRGTAAVTTRRAVIVFEWVGHTHALLPVGSEKQDLVGMAAVVAVQQKIHHMREK